MHPESIAHVTAGAYVNGRLAGRGLLISAKDVVIDGEFADDLTLVGKGVMLLPNGDSIDGLITGDWRDTEGLKAGVHRPIVPFIPSRSTARTGAATGARCR